MNVYRWHWISRRAFIIATVVPVSILVIGGSIVEGIALSIQALIKNVGSFIDSLKSAWSKDAIYYKVIEIKEDEDDDGWGI